MPVTRHSQAGYPPPCRCPSSPRASPVMTPTLESTNGDQRVDAIYAQLAAPVDDAESSSDEDLDDGLSYDEDSETDVVEPLGSLADLEDDLEIAEDELLTQRGNTDFSTLTIDIESKDLRVSYDFRLCRESAVLTVLTTICTELRNATFRRCVLKLDKPLTVFCTLPKMP